MFTFIYVTRRIRHTKVIVCNWTTIRLRSYDYKMAKTFSLARENQPSLDSMKDPILTTLFLILTLSHPYNPSYPFFDLPTLLALLTTLRLTNHNQSVLVSLSLTYPFRPYSLKFMWNIRFILVRCFQLTKNNENAKNVCRKWWNADLCLSTKLHTWKPYNYQDIRI